MSAARLEYSQDITNEQVKPRVFIRESANGEHTLVIEVPIKSDKVDPSTGVSDPFVLANFRDATTVSEGSASEPQKNLAAGKMTVKLAKIDGKSATSLLTVEGKIDSKVPGTGAKFTQKSESNAQEEELQAGSN